GFGEGETFLGNLVVTTDATGHIDTTPFFAAPENTLVSATATKAPNGAPLQDTSEFSQAVKRGGPPGVTVITHGFQPTSGGGDALLDLANAIVTRSGGTLLNYTVSGQGGQGSFTGSVDPNRENVVLFDWAAESNEFSPGWA